MSVQFSPATATATTGVMPITTVQANTKESVAVPSSPTTLAQRVKKLEKDVLYLKTCLLDLEKKFTSLFTPAFTSPFTGDALRQLWAARRHVCLNFKKGQKLQEAISPFFGRLCLLSEDPNYTKYFPLPSKVEIVLLTQMLQNPAEVHTHINGYLVKHVLAACALADQAKTHSEINSIMKLLEIGRMSLGNTQRALFEAESALKEMQSKK